MPCEKHHPIGLAIDPGKDCGLAWVSANVVSTRIVPLEELLQCLEDQFAGVEWVVCERPFITSNTHTSLFEAVGIVKAWCTLRKKELHFQEPFIRKQTFTRFKVPGASHAKDAAAHLVYFLEAGERSGRWTELLALLSAKPSGGAGSPGSGSSKTGSNSPTKAG